MNLIQGLRILLRSSMVLRWLSLTPESDGEQVKWIQLIWPRMINLAIRCLVIMARSPKLQLIAFSSKSICIACLKPGHQAKD
jgi:hypothetical protein